MSDLLVEASQILKELESRKKRNKIDQFYSTAENRAGYPVHMDFFAAGKEYRERLFLAGNRCISPWTEIRTAHGSRQCLEFLGETSFDVHSWDGAYRCVQEASGLFLKGIEKEFRVYLDNGEFFDCTRKHQVLTLSGFLSFDQIVHASSGLRLKKIPQGCQANYGKDNYLCGSQLPRQEDSDLKQFPLQDDAPQLDLGKMLSDEEERESQYNHVFQEFDHPSNLYDPEKIAGLCEKFQDPSKHIDGVFPKHLRQEFRRFVLEFFLLQEGQEFDLHQYGEGFLSQMQKEYSDASYKLELEHMKVGNVLLSGGNSFLQKSFESSDREERGTWIFSAFNTPELIGGAKILYIIPLGSNPVLDFTVKNTACYESGGVIHHNTGKTEGVGCYEISLHMTGVYPDWWVGRRFDKPVSVWVGGDTSTTVRDIIQLKLLGKQGEYGTGMIRGDCLIDTTNKRGVPDAVENVYVKHLKGGRSVAQLKSYDQGREAWQGTEQDIVLLDEEPPMPIYSEALIRTMTTDGMTILTFTPMLGMTEVTQSFMEDGDRGSV